MNTFMEERRIGVALQVSIQNQAPDMISTIVIFRIWLIDYTLMKKMI